MERNEAMKRKPGNRHVDPIMSRMIKLIQHSRAATNLRAIEHFRKVLHLLFLSLTRAPLAPWLTCCEEMENALAPLADLLALLVEQAKIDYVDYLGKVYEALGATEPGFGQYFTPTPVSVMLARMSWGGMNPWEQEHPILIHEPACGSGAILLALAGYLEENYPGVIKSGQVQFSGVDKDWNCVLMARINMIIHGIIAPISRVQSWSETAQEKVAKHYGVASSSLYEVAPILYGNALTMEQYETYAPILLMKQERGMHNEKIVLGCSLSNPIVRNR